MRRARSTPVTSRPALSHASACTFRPATSFVHHDRWRSADGGSPPTSAEISSNDTSAGPSGSRQRCANNGSYFFLATPEMMADGRLLPVRLVPPAPVGLGLLAGGSEEVVLHRRPGGGRRRPEVAEGHVELVPRQARSLGVRREGLGRPDADADPPTLGVGVEAGPEEDERPPRLL